MDKLTIENVRVCIACGCLFFPIRKGQVLRIDECCESGVQTVYYLSVFLNDDMRRNMAIQHDYERKKGGLNNGSN